MKLSDMMFFSALAAGAYYLYKGIGAPITNAIGAATEGVATTWVGLTSPSAPVPQGSVVLPNGTVFPASQLTGMQFGFDDGDATFLGNDGETYVLAPQVNGVYHASVY